MPISKYSAHIVAYVNDWLQTYGAAEINYSFVCSSGLMDNSLLLWKEISITIL